MRIQYLHLIFYGSIFRS